MKPLAKWEIINHGIFIEHNFPCPVCQSEAAICELWRGLYQPCWDCQKDGAYTVKAKTRFQKFLMRFFKDRHNDPHA